MGAAYPLPQFLNQDGFERYRIMDKTNKGRHSKRYKMKAGWAYIFLIPWLAVFCVFYLYPLFYGIICSFTNSSLNKMEWIGLDNYKKLIGDYAFWTSLKSTLLYCLICIPLNVFLPLWVANTLHPHGRKMNIASKLLIYLPGVTCAAALVIGWKFVFASNTGLLTQILSRMGFEHISFLDKASTAIPIVSLMVVLCNMGTNLIIYCAAIDSLPETYFEAAEMDGASKRDQFWKITFPLLNATIVYVFITATIGALQIFVFPQLMTAGGPNYTTSTLLMLVYDKAFSNNQFGYASAIGVVLFLITAAVALIQFKVVSKDKIEY